MGPRVALARTDKLDHDVLTGVYEMVTAAFEGDFDRHDWDHALGGTHALVREGGDPIAHAAVVARRILHDGRPLRVGYLEAVAVRADRRRLGLGAVILAALEPVIAAEYDIGLACSMPDSLDFYAACGWDRWEGRTWANTPDGLLRTEDDDDALFVLPGRVRIPPGGDLVCDWRVGDLW